MKRRIRIAAASLIVAAGLIGAVAAPASATPSSHFSEPVNFSFQLNYYTNLCGFPVFQSLVGTINTTLRYDSAGNIVSEVDTQPGTTLTFSSPTSGKSLSWPFALVGRTDYTNGGAVGSEATAYGSGLSIKAPGVSADGGRVVFSAVVVATTPDGIPIIGFTGVISSSAHPADPDAIDAAICAALAP
jgi:YD repeat-containing protein